MRATRGVRSKDNPTKPLPLGHPLATLYHCLANQFGWQIIV